MRRVFGIIGAALFFAVASVHAQWKEEVVPLVGGWNAVYLHVDTSDRLLSDWVGGDTSNPIEEIWMWVPPRPGTRTINDPSVPQSGDVEWQRWSRALGPSSSLLFLPGNVAILVRVSSNVQNYNWVIRGRALPPEQSWTSSGLNFIGFPVPAVNPPLWSDFLGPSRALHNHAEIYRYVGGEMSSSNPQRIFTTLLRATRMVRNHAYWVRSEEYNRYFGPFEVELQDPQGVHFGSRTSQYLLRLKNATDDPVTITANLLHSLAAPTANEPEVVGATPMIVRGERDMSDLTYEFSRFGEDHIGWTLTPKGQPGSVVDVVLGLDRSLMEGEPGDLFAAILRLTDDLGMIQVDLPVTASIAHSTGLWIGNAMINEVQHYLVQYDRVGMDGTPQMDEYGSYRIFSTNTTMGATVRSYPLRLLVHQGTNGNAKLMQRIYFGIDSSGATILARTEDLLNQDRLEEARQVSVIHLPWSADNEMWTFDGPLGPGAEITAEVVIPYTHEASNPFVHTYHPDHDNLDARFENELPRGVESYDIVRKMTLTVQDPVRTDFGSIVNASGMIIGVYEEELILLGRGEASRTLHSRGAFAMNQVVDIGKIEE